MSEVWLLAGALWWAASIASWACVFGMDVALRPTRVHPAVMGVPLLNVGLVPLYMLLESVGTWPWPVQIGPVGRWELLFIVGFLTTWSATGTAVALGVARALRPGQSVASVPRRWARPLIAWGGVGVVLLGVPSRGWAPALLMFSPFATGLAVLTVLSWARPGTRVEEAVARLDGLVLLAGLGAGAFAVGVPMDAWSRDSTITSGMYSVVCGNLVFVVASAVSLWEPSRRT